MDIQGTTEDRSEVQIPPQSTGENRGGRGKSELQISTISYSPPKAQMSGVTFHSIITDSKYVKKNTGQNIQKMVINQDTVVLGENARLLCILSEGEGSNPVANFLLQNERP